MKKSKLIKFFLMFLFAFNLCACGERTNTIEKLSNNEITAIGEFEEETTLEANKLDTSDDNFAAAIEKVADKDYDKEKVAVYDISLVKDNAKVQPSGKVKITMPAPFETENGYVTYHIKSETVDELETLLEGGKISFETTGFSYFVVAGTTGDSTIGSGPINPNDPAENFFAYVDTFDQATMTANGIDVPKGGYSATLKEGDTVELIAYANKGYEMLGWYKNEKASGSDERYDEMNNPATFTYTGTEKMYVYARFDVITYEITVNLNGGEFKSGESIPETYNVESETITLPIPEKGTTEFLGWLDADGNALTEIKEGSTGDLSLTAQWETPAYVRVDKNKNPDDNGEYVLFGSYPQTAVNRFDATALLSLNKLAGELPENGNNGKWTSYKYYYANLLDDGTTETTNEIDFMWYIDVEYKGETYRGVYFNYYRPRAAQGSFNTLIDGNGTGSRPQKTNKYFVGKTYWFKVEPILWKIIRQENGKAQLLCMSTLDAQPYTLLTRQSSEMVKDELDSHYVYFNDLENVPENTYANNYEYSSIRSWLNNNFFEYAFDAAQKALVCDTTLDNATAELGNNTIDRVFIPSLSDVENLGNYYIKASDYSQAQGVGTDYSNSWVYSWYIRENYYVLKYADKSSLISYDSTRYRDVVSSTNGNLYNPISKKLVGVGVGGIQSGVVASLWMTL